MKRILFILSSIIIAVLCLQIQAQNYPWSTNKKVILQAQFITNGVGPAWVKANLAAVEASPYDGLVIYSGNKGGYDVCYIFNQYWNSLDSTSLAGVQWTHCKDNFFVIFSNDDGAFKWFDDAQWVKILNNAGRLARAAKVANFKGLFFDTEPYGTVCAFDINKKADGHTTAELKAKVRQRGGQMMSVWQSNFPNITIFTSMLFSYIPTSDYRGLDWSLVVDWYNGMLDSIKGNTKLIEGDEASYYPNNTQDWFNRYQMCRTTWRAKCYPENLTKYDRYVQKANAPYDGQVTSNQEWEHNVYTGMMTADEYIWMYIEGSRWVPNPPTGPLEAVKSAITKYNSGQRLGFDMTGPSMGTSSFTSAIAVNITSPANNTKFATAPNTVTIKVTATGGAVDFYKNGLKVYTDNAAPYEYTVSLPSGAYTFVARANYNGVWGTSNPVNVYSGPIDINPPAIKITNPIKAGTVLSGVLPQGTITAEAYDPDIGTTNGSGIANILFELIQGTATVKLSSTDNSAPYEWSFDTAPFANGTYTLRATVTSTTAAGGGGSYTTTIVNVNNSGIIKGELNRSLT